MLKKLLALSTVALLVAACSGKSSLGSGENPAKGIGGKAGSDGGAVGGNSGVGGGTSGTGGAPTWDPCSGKPCGAECTICSPNDPSCVETAILKVCDANGVCSSTYPACKAPVCTTDKDCPAVEAPCQVCPDGSVACPFSKCESGQCVYGSDSCQGQVCKSDADCPAIGAPCQLCPDGSTACPYSKCENGQCSYGFPTCGGYDPCANKNCGDPCTQCPSNDPSCVETAVLKFCDASGQCGAVYPLCSNQCKSDLDCSTPATGLCKPCPDGSCALPACINGACDWQCPPPPTPQCKSALDCGPVSGICKVCGDGSCAVVDCVNGTCQFVCK